MFSTTTTKKHEPVDGDNDLTMTNAATTLGRSRLWALAPLVVGKFNFSGITQLPLEPMGQRLIAPIGPVAPRVHFGALEYALGYLVRQRAHEWPLGCGR